MTVFANAPGPAASHHCGALTRLLWTNLGLG